MPPRFAYWTIILDGAPTAFRARDRMELMGVFRQLANRNPNVTMKWFARGRLWESPEEARAASRAAREPRSSDWRPGGEHHDPRERFRKRPQEPRRGQARTRTAKNTPRDTGRGGDRRSPERRRQESRPPGFRSRDPNRRSRSKHERARERQGRPGTEIPRGSGESKPSEVEPPAPPPPPGPERPPKPGDEPRPETPPPETIRILPETPERAGPKPEDG